ncbi:hypothetical protein D6783_00620 [Candidatus Woesearchaeota archaeon]|nr:MAG: hypothetical protein D6783_00620 [Candidatus Woesearchaeota archaeon]
MGSVKHSLPRVVVVGAGYAGLSATRELSQNGNVEVVLVAPRRTFALLHRIPDVLAGVFRPREGMIDLRRWLRERQVSFVEGVVAHWDVRRRVLHVRGKSSRVVKGKAQKRGIGAASRKGAEHTLSYDYLVVACGKRPSKPRIPGLGPHAHVVDSLAASESLLHHVRNVLEKARKQRSEAVKESLTFVVCGESHEAIELAVALRGMVDDLAEKKGFDRGAPFVYVVGREDSFVKGLPSREREALLDWLEVSGITLLVDVDVQRVDGHHVVLDSGARIAARTLVWARVETPRFVESAGLAVEPGEGVFVSPDLVSVSDTRVFAAGDCCVVEGGSGGSLAFWEAAWQGRLAARNVLKMLEGRPLREWRVSRGARLVATGRGAALVRRRGVFSSVLFSWWRKFQEQRLLARLGL